MPKPQSGSWHHFVVLSSGFAGVSDTLGASRGTRGTRRRHQKAPRLCPIVLEPLEQRQLLTAAPIDPLAVSNGSNPSVSFTVYGGSNMASQVIAEDKLQSISNNTVSGSTSYVYNAVSTVNSVQQETVQIQEQLLCGDRFYPVRPPGPGEYRGQHLLCRGNQRL